MEILKVLKQHFDCAKRYRDYRGYYAYEVKRELYEIKCWRSISGHVRVELWLQNKLVQDWTVRIADLDKTINDAKEALKELCLGIINDLEDDHQRATD